MVRRQVIGIAALLLCWALARPTPVGAAADPQTVVTDFGNGALLMLGDPNLSQAQRRERFHALLDQDFDFPQVARFVLGRYWQPATEDQRKQFAVAFENYVVVAYSHRFDDFIGATFKVTADRPQGGDNVVVRTDVARHAGGPPAHVDWRVSQVGGAYKITEVSVDGVSMSLTHRQEFAAVMERNGGNITDLIAQIEQRTAAGAQ
jgi:phospholipid transport system substrate-binding protein